MKPANDCEKAIANSASALGVVLRLAATQREIAIAVRAHRIKSRWARRCGKPFSVIPAYQFVQAEPGELPD